MDDKVLTPKDLPKHHAIGRFFYGWNEQVYYCECYDPRVDYVLINVADPSLPRKNISPNAVNRTFHSAWDSYHLQQGDEIQDRTYLAVDTRVPPDQMEGKLLAEKDCLGLDPRIALFFYHKYGEKFIRKVKEAAAKLKAKAAQPA